MQPRHNERNRQEDARAERVQSAPAHPTHPQRGHAASPNRTRLPSCLKSAVLRNDSLRLIFRAAVRRFSCSWPSHGIKAINLYVLPLTAEPEVDFPLVPSATLGQADFLLDAWGARARDAGVRCTSTSVDLPDAPRLVMAQYWGWHGAFFCSCLPLCQHLSCFLHLLR